MGVSGRPTRSDDVQVPHWFVEHTYHRVDVQSVVPSELGEKTASSRAMSEFRRESYATTNLATEETLSQGRR
jgi:hypothetical protein